MSGQPWAPAGAGSRPSGRIWAQPAHSEAGGGRQSVVGSIGTWHSFATLQPPKEGMGYRRSPLAGGTHVATEVGEVGQPG